MTISTVLFDIDGTLVDSNDMHVLAWERAFAGIGVTLDRQRIHDQIGKGTDMFVPALLPSADEETRKALGRAHGDIFARDFLSEVKPFPGAHDLLARVSATGHFVVLATSASASELDHYLGLLDAHGLVSATTNGDDVEHTKPAPDIFATALEKAGQPEPTASIVVGDTPYDIEAAAKCGIRTVAVRSGKFSDDALWGAGAAALYDDVAALLSDYDNSLLALPQ